MFRPLAVGHIQGSRKFFDMCSLGVYLYSRSINWQRKNNVQQVGVQFRAQRNIAARTMYNIKFFYKRVTTVSIFDQPINMHNHLP